MVGQLRPHSPPKQPSDSYPHTPPAELEAPYQAAALDSTCQADSLAFQHEVLSYLDRIEKSIAPRYVSESTFASASVKEPAYGAWLLPPAKPPFSFNSERNVPGDEVVKTLSGGSVGHNSARSNFQSHGKATSASKNDFTSDLHTVQEVETVSQDSASPPPSLLDRSPNWSPAGTRAGVQKWLSQRQGASPSNLLRLLKREASQALSRQTTGSSLPASIISPAAPAPPVGKSPSVLGIPQYKTSVYSGGFKGMASTSERLSAYVSKPLKVAQDFALAQGWIRLGFSSGGLGGLTQTISFARSPLGWGSSTYCQEIVKSSSFDSICALLIIANAIFLATATEHAAVEELGSDDDLPSFFSYGDYIFTGWFLVELLLRMFAVGPCQFWSWHSPMMSWNYFDTTVVTMNVIETIMAFQDDRPGANLTALRVMRILRVARALRIVRLVRLFRALRKMVLSILGSFTTLVWAIVLLLMVIFIFGLFLTDHVSKHLYSGEVSDQVKHSSVLKDKFGSLALTAYTLFLSVSGGVSWQEVSDPLFEINVVTGLIFCFYIFFTVFAMLNIITGIFVDTAMSAAQNDKDECIVEQLQAQDSAIRQMQRIFEDADTDGSGAITFDEFNTHLSDEKMRAHLASLGIDTSEAQGLFRLLDLDNSGLITPEEFLVGCMKLKGNAKAIDVATLLYENKRMVQKWTGFMLYVEKQFKVRHAFEIKQEERTGTMLNLLQSQLEIKRVSRPIPLNQGERPWP